MWITNQLTVLLKKALNGILDLDLLLPAKAKKQKQINILYNHNSISYLIEIVINCFQIFWTFILKGFPKITIYELYLRWK